VRMPKFFGSSSRLISTILPPAIAMLLHFQGWTPPEPSSEKT
jgi:hypothetical protein